MSRLSSIAHTKSFSIDASATIGEAMAYMLENKDGSVVLLDEGQPVGVVTEGLLLSLFEEGGDLTQLVRPIASTPVIIINQN